MKLSNAKFQYNENGAWVDIQELISCDITFTNTPSRSSWERNGTYTNEDIDSIAVNFKRGYNSLLDGVQVGSIMPIKWNNGALAYTGKFIVSQKFNTKTSGFTNTYISFDTKDDEPISILARGGEGGHVDDVEVTDESGTRSVVSGGIAEINISGYAKKADIETELDKKLNKSGDAMTGNLNMAGHVINMVGGRITNVTKGSDDDAVPLKYIKDNFAQGTQITQVQTDLANEVIRASNKENEIITNLNTEITNRTNADTTLQNNISAEVQRATAAEEILDQYCESLQETKVNKATGSQEFSIGVDANGIYVED